MINNSSLSPLCTQITNGDIDCTFTKEWINYNPLSIVTDAKLSKLQDTRIKKGNFLYPTADIQQRNYPRLFPNGTINCIQCDLTPDNNEHIGS